MYADEDSRGGVLEPEGIVGIKFRRDRQLDTMARLDPTYGELKRRAADSNLSAEEKQEVTTKIKQREELLLPVYAQVSIQFADLHDRTGRMMAKGTIRKPLQWQNARRFFYWRLRRRLNEEMFLRKMEKADKGSTRAQNLARLKSLIITDDESTIFDVNDMLVATWYEDNQKDVLQKIEALKQEAVSAEVDKLIGAHGKSALRGVAAALHRLTPKEKDEVLKLLATPLQSE